MQKTRSIVENLIKLFVYGVLICIISIVILALFSKDSEKEAEIGSFESNKFNEDWTLETKDKTENISLPYFLDAKEGDILVIKNTLPDNLVDGSCLMMRSSMEDTYIYINNELREVYSTENSEKLPYYIPSAYVVTELSKKDSGSEVRIELKVKARGAINEIEIGKGNNVWFDVLKNNMTASAVTFVVLVMGIMLIIAATIMQRYISNFTSIYYLGFLMMDVAIWIFSESNIRQLIFRKTSLVSCFTYISFGLLGVLTCLFFDEVQKRQYHKSYLIIEVITCIQLAINTVLNFTRIAEYHKTLIFMHIWLILELICVTINVGKDIFKKRLYQYGSTAIGIVIFLIFSLFELVAYYISDVRIFGNYVSIGLVALTVATIIQIFIDQNRESKEREIVQKNMLVNIIETIASAIDAKDEYTGGHSERVGRYASILARAMAKDYELSEEDILRIMYIGNMHDIGKIGVSDSILNKAGRLTDEEYSLMKKHVEVGSELITDMGDSIEGLIDGIRYHHERYDGKGYPEGLSGSQIPLIARIICIADRYDAMTSNRVYRKRLTREEVRKEFLKSSGKQFDPDLVKIFIGLMDSEEIVPHTIDGMVTNKVGNIMKAVRLEEYIHIMSNSDETRANNPSHISMLCYIMKQKEKNGEHADVLMITLMDEDIDNLELVKKHTKKYLKLEDISIEYNSKRYIITLFNRTDEQIEDIIESIKKCTVKVDVEKLFD